MKKTSTGFTVIELLIVLAILGTLLAIAIPSYQEYTRKAARAEAKGTMLDIAQMQERYFSNNGTYLAIAAPPAAAPTGWKNYSGGSASGSKYNISVAAGSTGSLTTSFTITAAPITGYSEPTCGTLSIESNGTKGSNSGSGSPCW
jgi:type IV pilus assembly protein PilE